MAALALTVPAPAVGEPPTASVVVRQSAPVRISDMRQSAPIPPGASPYLPDGRTRSGTTDQPIPCRCRAHGTAYQVDDVVCLVTPRGPLKARCARVDNITSWIISDEPCVMAGIADPSRLASVH
ncbi:MAG: hypothetical protein ACREC6_13295 [Hyphomicrobiaceae bacterium]